MGGGEVATETDYICYHGAGCNGAGPSCRPPAGKSWIDSAAVTYALRLAESGNVAEARARIRDAASRTFVACALAPHADMEERARFYNEGYADAVAQGLADDPALASEWLEAEKSAAVAAALDEVERRLVGHRRRPWASPGSTALSILREVRAQGDLTSRCGFDSPEEGS